MSKAVIDSRFMKTHLGWAMKQQLHLRENLLGRGLKTDIRVVAAVQELAVVKMASLRWVCHKEERNSKIFLAGNQDGSLDFAGACLLT